MKFKIVQEWTGGLVVATSPDGKQMFFIEGLAGKNKLQDMLEMELEECGKGMMTYISLPIYREAKPKLEPVQVPVEELPAPVATMKTPAESTGGSIVEGELAPVKDETPILEKKVEELIEKIVTSRVEKKKKVKTEKTSKKPKAKSKK